jgi:hypothetical protein
MYIREKEVIIPIEILRNWAGGEIQSRGKKRNTDFKLYMLEHTCKPSAQAKAGG